MFTGIVRGKGKVIATDQKNPGVTLIIAFPDDLLSALEIGASVAIDGVCLTVRKQDKNLIHFDVIEETLSKTTLRQLKHGSLVNLERAAKLGDEIGGHLLSGHVMATARVRSIQNNIYSFDCAQPLMKYFFAKGYIAVDGVSLTLVDVLPAGFTVHLIPETLRATILGTKKVGDAVNIEIDSMTLQIVDTTLRYLGTK